VRYFIDFSYAGTHYHGWQRQPNAVSVQEVLEDAFEILLKSPSPLVAAGRTDTGVHAQQMVAHFDVDNPIDDAAQWVYRLNQFLPKDIALHSVQAVKPDAHARFDALSRTYQYHVQTQKTPFGNDMQYGLHQALDFEQMNKAAEVLLGYEDFECFSKSNTDVKTFLCKISYAKWEKTKNGYIFTIKANRFLRNMVRAIVGTLIEIGLKKKTIEDLHHIIRSKNRSLAGYSVPAQGLFLTQVEYPKSVYLHE